MSGVIKKIEIPNFNNLFLDYFSDFFNLSNKPIHDKTIDNIGNQFPEIINY